MVSAATLMPPPCGPPINHIMSLAAMVATFLNFQLSVTRPAATRRAFVSFCVSEVQAANRIRPPKLRGRAAATRIEVRDRSTEFVMQAGR